MPNNLSKPVFAPAPAAQIVRKLAPSAADRRVSVEIPLPLSLQSEDLTNYANVVVRKPWGYEYLAFANGVTSVWILFIKNGRQTSLHCHPNKKTSIVFLSGEGICSTLEDSVVRRPGEGVLFGAGVYHRTRSSSADGTFLMEIENPMDKLNLVRFQDDYGREHMDYEKGDSLIKDLPKENYISFPAASSARPARAALGPCSIELLKFSDSAAWRSWVHSQSWATMSILKGTMVNGTPNSALGPGDLLGTEDKARYLDAKLSGELETIVIRKS